MKIPELTQESIEQLLCFLSARNNKLSFTPEPELEKAFISLFKHLKCLNKKFKNKQSRWAKAPKWANYIAMDQNGNWFYYETKPTKGRSSWISTNKVKYFENHALVCWDVSLEPRPKIKEEERTTRT